MISKSNFKTLYLLFGIIVLLILAIVGSQYLHNRATSDNVKSTARKIALYKVYSKIQNAETSQRGYMITRDSLYRRSIIRISESVFQILQELEISAEDTLSFSQTNTLYDLTSQKLSELDFTTRLIDQGLVEEAMKTVNTDNGEILMNQIDHLINKMIKHTDANLSKNDKSTKLFDYLTFLLIVSLLLIAIFLVYRIASQIAPLVDELEKKAVEQTAIIKVRDTEIVRRKKIEKRNRTLIKSLQEKNKELNHFAYIASHDLHEPLRTVNNFIDIFKEDYGEQLGKGDAPLYFEYIQNATQRMRELIEGLLKYSQIGRSGEYVMTDLNDLVKGVTELLKDQIDINDAEITCHKLPTLSILPTEINQLFQNLISNGIKFRNGSVPSKVYIECEDQGSHVLFRVIDNGIGIEKDKQHKIFDMYARLHSQREYEGRGLGLAFCKKIVELHEGEIWVESVPHVGSSFYFTLKKDLENEKN